MTSLLDIPDKIDELERRLAELENQPQADQLQPNVLTINPDGTIGADLTGHLKASGVDLAPGTSGAPPASSRVRWFDQATGADIADIFGTRSGGVAPSVLQAEAIGEGGVNESATATLLATNAGPSTETAELQNQAGHNSSQVVAAAFDERGSAQVTLISAAGVSDLLQLAATGNHHIAFGVVNMALAGTSGNFAVAHGLPVGPNVALAQADGSTANDLTVGTSNYGSATFTVYWRRASGSATGFNCNFYWLAIS